MIDTHSHIYQEEYDVDRAEVIAHARNKHVSKVVLANVDSTTIEPMKRTANEYPDFCSMAMGVHPTSVTADNYADELLAARAELANGSYCAIGEIGVDLYWDKTYVKEQINVFETQLDWAVELNLPVIIHTRKAFAEVFASFAKFKGKSLRGVFHCFGGGIEEARKVLSLGDFFLGIDNMVTYKNSSLPTILEHIGLEHILLETDAPSLSPVPYRGKRNEPQFLEQISEKLAEIYKVLPEKVDEETTNNAHYLLFS